MQRSGSKLPAIPLMMVLLAAGLMLPAMAASADAAGHGVRGSGELLQVTYNQRYSSHNHRYQRRHSPRSRYHRSPRSHSRYSRNRYYRDGYSNSYRSGYRRNHAYSHRGYRNSNRSCRSVSKRGYWYGRRALVGGRECINSRGYSYIAPGSRFLIRYR